MTKDQLLGIVRHAAGFAGAYLVTAGKIDSGLLQEATGAVLAVAALVWSIWEKTRRA